MYFLSSTLLLTKLLLVLLVILSVPLTLSTFVRFELPLTMLQLTGRTWRRTSLPALRDDF